MNMKFLMMGLLMPFAASAQEIEAVDSIDVETGVIYYADSTQVSDTISADTIDCAVTIQTIMVWCIKTGSVASMTS